MNSFFLALRFLTIIPLGRRREVDPDSVAFAMAFIINATYHSFNKSPQYKSALTNCQFRKPTIGVIRSGFISPCDYHH